MNDGMNWYRTLKLAGLPANVWKNLPPDAVIQQALRFGGVRGVFDGRDWYFADGNDYIHADICRIVGWDAVEPWRIVIDHVNRSSYADENTQQLEEMMMSSY